MLDRPQNSIDRPDISASYKYKRAKPGHTLVALATVLLLLLIGRTNCSIFMPTRGEARQRELALRKAARTSCWQIIRPLLVESLVASCSGAVLRVAASYWLAQLP